MDSNIKRAWRRLLRYSRDLIFKPKKYKYQFVTAIFDYGNEYGAMLEIYDWEASRRIEFYSKKYPVNDKAMTTIPLIEEWLIRQAEKDFGKNVLFEIKSGLAIRRANIHSELKQLNVDILKMIMRGEA